jgi:serine/threonine protein kinase
MLLRASVTQRAIGQGRNLRMADVQNLETGRWIWPFQILERIGEGGMGHVYRAQYVPRKIDVALKMVPSEVTDPTTLARFEREMEVLKDLKHPHIVRTFGGISEDKQRFYAMELLPGGTLDDELRDRGRLTWEKVVEYGLQMCSALEYLHSKGVVHRDVKPSNFLRTADGRIKLSDFGLASVIAQRKITAEGRTAGTFLYMAPEQIRGAGIVPQTDLYAMGCVLFELLSGRPPFIGDTPAATLHKHCHATPPRVTEYALDCPLTLERIIARLLEKKPEDRIQSASDLSRELTLVTQAVELSTPRQHDPTRKVGNQLVKPRVEKIEDDTHTEMLKRLEPGEVPRWRRNAEIGGGVAIALLLGWVVWLNSSLTDAQRSEALWIEAAKNSSPEVRRAAIGALQELKSDEALQALADVLANDSNANLRAVAAEGLGAAGADARAHVVALHKAQKEDDQVFVRNAAATAIKQIQE